MGVEITLWSEIFQSEEGRGDGKSYQSFVWVFRLAVGNCGKAGRIEGDVNTLLCFKSQFSLEQPSSVW